MQSRAVTVNEYIDSLSGDRKDAMEKLRTAILNNIPKGFVETMNYGMIGYVVPHSIYPDGYHCNRELPLAFINIASQKNFIAVYHMGIYANKKLLDWFIAEYSKHSKAKLDMGKSCIRLKKIEQIPYELIGKLASRLTPDEWIKMYEAIIKR